MILPSVLLALLDLSARFALVLGLTVPFLRERDLDFNFFRFWRWRLPRARQFVKIAAVSILFTAFAAWALPMLDSAVQNAGASIGSPSITPEHPQIVLMQFSPWLLLLIATPNAVVEEWFFRRGLLGGLLRRKRPLRVALPISAAGFGAVHLLNPGTGWLAFIGPFFAGLILAGAYLCGGIQSSCAVHVGYNAAVVLGWL